MKKILRLFQTLGRIDLKNVWQDDFLSWMLFMPLGLGLLLRFGFPYVLRAIGELIQKDLLIHYPILTGFFILLMSPIASGTIIGFLLLEQRDDRTMTALQVTPLSPVIYLIYLLSLPMLASFLITVITFFLAGLGSVGLRAITVTSLASAPLAPLAALTLASFAENKVQGFAFVKASIVLWIAPVSAYFLKSKWELAFGVVPLYWPCKLYWLFSAADSGIGFNLVAGLIYNGFILALLLQKFKKTFYNG
jgi:fluoroquinolone transport system permease protein